MWTQQDLLGENARVWVYSTSRDLSPEEVRDISFSIEQFCNEWTSHNRPVMACGGVYDQSFIVLMGEVRDGQISGCSMDAATNFVRTLDSRYNLDLFNRTRMVFREGDKQRRRVDINDLSEEMEAGNIFEGSLFFDPLVSVKKDFEKNWPKPLSSSWLAQRVM